MSTDMLRRLTNCRLLLFIIITPQLPANVAKKLLPGQGLIIRRLAMTAMHRHNYTPIVNIREQHSV